MVQSRTIEQKSAKLVDQAAVRAAINGSILILEGLEKAERNILPILVRHTISSNEILDFLIFHNAEQLAGEP